MAINDLTDSIQLSSKINTLPETNIAPENRPSQKESSFPTIIFGIFFRGELLVSGSVSFKVFGFRVVCLTTRHLRLGSLQDEWGKNLNILLVSHGGVVGSWCPKWEYPGFTISTLLHDRINPKDCQVLSLGDTGFLQFFRVVSRDYGKPRYREP